MRARGASKSRPCLRSCALRCGLARQAGMPTWLLRLGRDPYLVAALGLALVGVPDGDDAEEELAFTRGDAAETAADDEGWAVRADAAEQLARRIEGFAGSQV